MSKNHELLESYLGTTSMVQQQIDSYNRFINLGVHKVVETHRMIEPEVSDFAIKLESVRFEMPRMIEADSSVRKVMPNEALARNLTYSAPMYLTYVPMISGIEKKDAMGEVFVGELPVMVKSDLCYTKGMSREQLSAAGEDPDDPGGYFIIRGIERALIGIEDLAPNRVMCNKRDDGIVARVLSTSLTFKSRCTVTRDNYGMFTVLFPTATKGIDLILVLRALGLGQKEVLENVTNEDIKNDFMLNIAESKAVEMTPNEGLEELGKISAPAQPKAYQHKRGSVQVDTYILPHLGIDAKSRMNKARFLLHMAARASLVAYGYTKEDDRDHYANKRVRLAGDLVEELFNEAFKAFSKDIKYHIERTTARGRRLTVRTSINPDTLTEKIKYAMGTGSWPGGHVGVSQVLDRMNFLSSLAHLRRVKSPLTKKHAHFKARDVHGTHIGKICPSETPEGQEVGLTRYLAIMSKVTVGTEETMVEDKLKELKLI
ncbi:MAG: DNA-directed RNA polymerase subunit B'' [Candidatus Marsarchaeota archaeon]|jgi:DNA-directed RNA polymerase beta subunit|nr:DNA-directed RNA polymerase subunit B'' [Candidatus Marsarchaeota archaeon]